MEIFKRARQDLFLYLRVQSDVDNEGPNVSQMGQLLID